MHGRRRVALVLAVVGSVTAAGSTAGLAAHSTDPDDGAIRQAIVQSVGEAALIVGPEPSADAGGTALGAVEPGPGAAESRPDLGAVLVLAAEVGIVILFVAGLFALGRRRDPA